MWYSISNMETARNNMAGGQQKAQQNLDALRFGYLHERTMTLSK